MPRSISSTRSVTAAFPAPRLQLELIGPPRARVDGRMLTFPTRKTLALLAFLALEPGRHSRERLAGLLWPDSDEERARTALRRTLLRLRKVIGATAVAAGRNEVELLRPIELDLDLVRHAAMAKAAAREDLEAVAAAVRGDLLEGLAVPDAEPFEEWLASRREAWHLTGIEVLQRACLAQQAEGRLPAALNTALRWCALDRYSEEAHRSLIQLHLARGDRTAAIAAAASVRRILSDELATEPGSELKEVMEIAARVDRLLLPAASPEETPLVGRQQEHRALVDQLELARAGQTVVVLLAGEAGMGKTRLLSEFGRWAAGRPAAVMTSRALPVSAPSLQPVADLLRPHAAILATRLDPLWSAELARLLPELGEPPRAAGHPLRLQEAATRALLAAAGRLPLVLMLDDVQWAGPDTLELIAYSIRNRPVGGPGYLLVLACRAESLDRDTDLNARLAALDRRADPRKFSLRPLGLEDVRALADAIGARTLPARVVRTLLRESRGNPLLLLEALRHPDAWTVHVRSLLETRAAGLSKTARTVMAAGAGDGRWT